MPALGQSPSADSKGKILFFFSHSCHNCHEVKDGILSMVARDHHGSIDIEYRDIGDIENYKLLLGIREKLGSAAQIQVPAVYFAGQLLIGKEEVENNLLALIRKQPSSGNATPSGPGHIPAVDLVQYFMGFTPVAVIGAGLIDGINPCAFTVIVFFISFLSLQGYSRKELVVIGAGFIFAVFLTYLLLGLGLFGFFYSIKGVMYLRRLFNAGIGVFTVCLGLFAVRDIVKFARTGSTEGMALRLPESIKLRIHKVIGLAYRKDRAATAGTSSFSFPAVFLTALTTGFLISLLEAVCTGQVYLPAITYVLKTSSLRIQAAWYLVLYNIMFIAPLVAVFLLALAGVKSGQFSGFLKRHFILVKSLLAGIFFILGIFLLWRG